MPRKRERADRYVALWRGINVGGKNKLPMRHLVSIYESAGALNVRTYIQSGNVIYDATLEVATRLDAAVIDAVEARFGFRSHVITRGPRAFRNILANQPFTGAEESRLYVAFLQSLPAAEDADSLSNERSPADAFEIIGREVYLHLPNGAARTQLTTNYLDKVLRTKSTIRNWRTVKKLAEISET